MPKPAWQPVTVDDAALRFAQQTGFVSLEVVDEPIMVTADGMTAEQPPKKQKKQKQKKQKEDTAPSAGRKRPAEDSVEDVAVDPVEPSDDSLASAAPKKDGKRKKKKQRKEEQETATAEDDDTAVAPDADLFASLAAELTAAKDAKAQAERQEHEAREALAAAKRAAAKEAKRSQKVSGEAEHGRGGDDETPDSRGAMSARPVEGAAGWVPFGLHEALLHKLAAAGFEQPTPIQRECLPSAIHGRRDVVGAAETGSGKTLAFGLPILQRLLDERHAGGGGTTGHQDGAERTGRPLFALIIAPTRELAAQVAEHLQAVAPPTVQVISLVGGMSIDKQRRLLSRCPEVAVGP